MSTELLDETLGATAGTFAAAKLANTPGIIGVTAIAKTGEAGTALPNGPAIRIELFSANLDIDITSDGVAKIVNQLRASSVGSFQPTILETQSDIASHFDVLATGEFLYAVVHVVNALTANIGLEVQISAV